ncbi:MAG: transporter, partial [Prevotellaceae bacterium]|nr:transporter [Prevotellaceae bacterium]
MKKIVLSAVLFGSTLSMMAGGYLTNTNQSVAFLRNPAQDANINLNGVYSNPAGVNFLQPGFHFGINLQSAYQTREIQSAFKAFEYGIRNNGSASKTFKAEAKAPVIPSLQGAWVNGPLSLQVNLALVGGGGKATYHNGLGSFESKVALLGAIGNANHALGFNRYDVDAYMHGRQYFYGLTLGAGYRIGEHFSIYGGVRGVLAAAHYDGYLRNIRINGGDRNGNQMTSAPEYLKQKSNEFASAAATNGKLALTAANAATQAAAEAQAASEAGNIALAQSKSAEAKEQAQLAQSY